MSVLINKEGNRSYHKRVFDYVILGRLTEGPINYTTNPLKKGEFEGTVSAHSYVSRNSVIQMTFRGTDKSIVETEMRNMFKRLMDFQNSRRQVLNLSEMTFECECTCEE